jgi:thiamine biosynthesis lipoprotein
VRDASPINRRQLLAYARDRRIRSENESRADEWIRVARDAMACRFEAILPDDDGKGAAAVQKYLDEVDRLETILSVFRPTSEVCILNCRGAYHVAPEFFELLQLCQRLHRETEGAFDITTGILSRCWGFEERRPAIPALEALAKAREAVGFHRVKLGEDRTVRFEEAGLRINLGGIGKGYALDRGAAELRDRGVKTALLSAGFSSLLAIGDGAGGAGWMVGLRHPVRNNERLGTVRLRSCALATSGHEEQSFKVNGQTYGHIIDSRTGFPAQGVASVTVIANSAAEADGLATAFFVAGPELARRYCATRPGVMALMLLENNLSCPLTIGATSGATAEFANE